MNMLFVLNKEHLLYLLFLKNVNSLMYNYLVSAYCVLGSSKFMQRMLRKSMCSATLKGGIFCILYVSIFFLRLNFGLNKDKQLSNFFSQGDFTTVKKIFMRITGRQLGKYWRFPFSYTCQFGFLKLFSLTYPTNQFRYYAPNTESRCCPRLYTFKQETVLSLSIWGKKHLSQEESQTAKTRRKARNFLIQTFHRFSH